MDVVKAIVVLGLFFLGLVLAFQGIVGKEMNLGWLRMPIDLEHPGMNHAPERHRLRLVLIGVGLMAAAVGIGIVIL